MAMCETAKIAAKFPTDRLVILIIFSTIASLAHLHIAFLVLLLAKLALKKSTNEYIFICMCVICTMYISID